MTQDYIGEYFMAVLTGPSNNRSWHIMQLDPLLYLAQTDRRELAIELVNRLDTTGDVPVGQSSHVDAVPC